MKNIVSFEEREKKWTKWMGEEKEKTEDRNTEWGRNETEEGSHKKVSVKNGKGKCNWKLCESRMLTGQKGR